MKHKNDEPLLLEVFNDEVVPVVKPIINTNYSRKVFPPNEQDFGKSLTKPNQVLGIEQIMARIESGQMLPERAGFYTEEELPITATPLDFTDLDSLNNNGKSISNEMDKLIVTKKKQKAEQEQKERDEFLKWKKTQESQS